MHPQREQLLNSMRVGGTYPGSYYLNCGFERRVTVSSQQIRGISLISALLASGNIRRMGKGPGESLQRIAIIGAGVAGVSAAVRAAYAGCHVAIFETAPEPLQRFAGSNRLLHPRLYEWPRDGFGDGDAGLPLFSWQAQSGGEVTNELLKQWEFYQNMVIRRGSNGMKGKIDTYLNCKPPRPVKGPGTLLQIDTERGTTEESFQAVIYAMGFGADRSGSWIADSFQLDPYWTTDVERIRNAIAAAARENRPARMFLSGLGDSGLTDLFSCVDPQFRQETIQQRFIDPLVDTPWAEKFTALFRHQTESTNPLDPAEFETALRELIKTCLDRGDLQNPFVSIQEIELTLHGRKHPFNNETFPLNRLILAFLLESGRVTEHPRLSDAERVPDRFEDVAVVSGDANLPQLAWPPSAKGRRFDVVLVRHGAERSLEKCYPEVFNEAKATRDTLDGSATSYLADTGEIFFRNTADGSAVPVRALYSDLYDSIIQLQLARDFDKHGFGRWFLPLYKGRLVRDLLVFDRLILTDSQFLDGRFFLDWALADADRGLTLGDLAELSRTGLVELRFRANSHSGDSWPGGLWQTLFEILFRVEKAVISQKDFLLSSIGSRATGDAVKLPEPPAGFAFPDPQSFARWSTADTGNWLRSTIRDRLMDLDQETAAQGMRMIGYWDQLALHEFSSVVWDGAFSFESAFEDPWRIWQELLGAGDDEMKNLLLEACASKVRTKVRDMTAAIREPAKSHQARALYDYYNRAYNRAIARQHGATVIETTFVKGWVTKADTTPKQLEPSWRINLALSELSLEQILKTRALMRHITDPLERTEFVSRHFGKGDASQEGSDLANLVGALTPEIVKGWEPEMVLLLVSDRIDCGHMDEYRIFDDISPASRMHCRAIEGLSFPSCCSVLEFQSPTA